MRILIHHMPMDTSYCWITRNFMVKFTNYVFLGADNMKRDLRISYEEREVGMLLQRLRSWRSSLKSLPSIIRSILYQSLPKFDIKLSWYIFID